VVEEAAVVAELAESVAEVAITDVAVVAVAVAVVAAAVLLALALAFAAAIQAVRSDRHESWLESLARRQV